MKKIGIITYPQIEDGKGRFLQAYALYCAIHSIGFEPTILNYKSELFNYKPSIKRAIKNVIKKPSELLAYFSVFLKRIKDKKAIENINISRDKYISFINEKMRYTEILNKETLCNVADSYDAFVCGSDQIWNTHFACGLDPVYYLDFVKKGKRIAYAASMGTLNIDEKTIERVIPLIKKIDYCSVREKTTAETLNSIYETKIQHVFDPTFLMDRKWWNNLAGEKVTDKEYVLVFTFDNNKAPLRWALRYAKAHSLQVLVISDVKKTKKQIRNVGGLGPAEFVSLFKYAKCVFTQSFHGTVLSLLFEKEFYVFDRKNRSDVKGLILRIKDLLDEMMLGKRIVENENDYWFSPIDYSFANTVISKRKEEGLSFLKKSLLSAIK